MGHWKQVRSTDQSVFIPSQTDTDEFNSFMIKTLKGAWDQADERDVVYELGVHFRLDFLHSVLFRKEGLGLSAFQMLPNSLATRNNVPDYPDLDCPLLRNTVEKVSDKMIQIAGKPPSHAFDDATNGNQGREEDAASIADQRREIKKEISGLRQDNN